MIDSSANHNNGSYLKQKAKAFGIDVSAIIDDLKGRISTQTDQKDYFAYTKGISKEFIAGIAHYVKKYELHKVIIGHIDGDGPGELLIYIDKNGNIIRECPTCMESKTFDSDSVHFYLDEPDQMARNLIYTIIKAYEDKKKTLETYCSSLDEL
jgi:hypothetical protein